MAEDSDYSNKQRWHVGKEVPLALIFTVLVQTAALVWWARGQVAIDADHERRLALLEKEREAGRLSERVAVIEQAVIEIRKSSERTEALLTDALRQGGRR